MFTAYVKERGLGRFRRDVLDRMSRREIGLAWLRRRLMPEGSLRSSGVMPIADWEDFLKDDEGHAAPSRRLFQMHLRLANLYREAKEHETQGVAHVEEGL